LRQEKSNLLMVGSL